jgi:hypothetical protein
MGCDIHAMFEWRADSESHYWHNGGDPRTGRCYELFAILANVRNYDDIPFISEPRGIPEGCSTEFEVFSKSWGADGHSHSHLTLRELKGYDVDQEFEDQSLILSRDTMGNITSTCRATTGEHLGKVGKRKVFDLWGRETWDDLIKDMEHIRDRNGITDDDVRLVFFFDN